MKLTLVKQGNFHGITCDFYQDKQGNVFMTREQIGAALEYSNPNDSIRKIHSRHKDRLNKLSVSVKLSGTDGKLYAQYVYMEKGIYEVIRHSEQPKADEFYDYVYEIMEGIRTERISHDVLRGAGIEVRRSLTDAINDAYKDSPHKRFQYTNYTNLIYKHLFGKNAKELRLQYAIGKEDDLRERFTAAELKLIRKVENQVCTLIDMGMDYEGVKAALLLSGSRAVERKRERSNQNKQHSGGMKYEA